MKLKLKKRNGDYAVENAVQEARAAQNDDGTLERGQWSNQAEFILSCLGYAMGLGNVWKFPYTCFSNGGGAYLIPYIVVLAVIGIPTFFLELIMGQWSGRGPIQIWSLAPIFQGVGLGMLLISSMINIFYTVLLAYCLYYFAMCFQKHLPWDTCKHDFNTEFCFNIKEVTECRKNGSLWYNKTCHYATTFSEFDEIRFSCTTLESQNVSNCSEYVYNEKWESLKNLTTKLVSSSEEYFFLGVLEKSDSIENPGRLKWQLVLCLLGMWTICFLSLIKGIQSSGKVVYFTTTFPYFVLTVLLIRGALLDGSKLGIQYYLTPDWNRLKDAKVWGDAAGQIFFALSIGAGGLLTYSSYNRFYSNIYRNALLVAILNACTDWYAGFVVFSALGYMAHSQNVRVQDVATSGAGLAFVVYPQVLATLPVPQLWSALFFLMLIMLGLDSLNAGVEALITSTVDRWPRLRKVKWMVTLSWCMLLFLLGLPMCTRGGYYWLDLVAYYSSGWTLVVMGIVESIVFSWVYGARKVMDHVREMVGFKLYPHWWVLWTFACPLLLIAVLIFNLISFQPLRWGAYDPPVWVPALGWLMTLAPLGLILIVAVLKIIQVLKVEDTYYYIEKIQLLFKPTSDWMSADERAKRGTTMKPGNVYTVEKFSTSHPVTNDGFS